ncbi:MAG: hypothetical protein FJ039_06345 [Chloroflexi bacterium]|nr:hypothetical protein [Chloroflexota bacterium]
MELSTSDNVLHIRLSRWEKVWAVHRDLQVPVAKMERAHTERPETIWPEIRAPGSFMPGVIKAGTYHLWQERKWSFTRAGLKNGRYREFWYATRGNRERFLVVELTEHRYRRIVLTHPDNVEWAKRINRAIEGVKAA